MDPSYNESGILLKESDVYSFGVVLFEMLTGMLVYCRRSIDNEMERSLIHLVRRYYDNELDKLIDPQIKDQIDSGSFDKFKKIAYECISFKPTERPTMDMVIDRIEEALDFELQKNDAALIECVMEDIGFSHGIPVLAFTIYKCLLNQKYLTTEETTVFDRLLKIFNSAIQDRDDNQMAYWLSNASTLLFLIHKSLRPPSSTLSFGKMEERFRSVSLAEDALIVKQVEGKNPALLFEQQLTEYVEKVYSIICDNLKIKLGPLLSLCTNQAPPKSKGVSISEISASKDSRFNYWQGILNHLNTLLNTLKENSVRCIIIQKIFAQIFSCINMELFNSLLRGQEWCNISNGEYMKAGLADLEHWCILVKEMYAGSAWDKLKHIRQAIGFLTLHEKRMLSYDKFSNDLCPILSRQQLYQLWTLYWGDNSDGRVSSNVISSLRILMKKDYDDASSNSLLLDDNSSIPFSVDDLSTSLQVKDFANVEPALQLSKYGAFRFLYN
ncbi:hypothetical protein L1887_18213 [Cichorium endivia]|nr:hypothetical protein L1887_18213 [Cichorium endivia]